MKKKTRSYRFLINLCIILVVLAGVVAGGFLALDKVVVPKYFGKYGINSMRELVDMVKTMHAVPSESDFVKNPHSKKDKTNAKNKLLEVGFPKLLNGEINYSEVIKEDFFVVTSPEYPNNYLELSDTEVAAMMDDILDSGVLIPELKDLSYLDTLSMEVTEVIITPTGKPTKIILSDSTSESTDDPEGEEPSEEPTEEPEAEEVNSYLSARISITIKVNLSDAITQMSKNLDVPLFLLNMIIPNRMYITSSFNTSINEVGLWEYSDTSLTVNAKTQKQSEVVLNLLISFIYPEDEEMSIEKLSNEIADMVRYSLELIGEITFADDIKVGTTNYSGIRVKLTKQSPE